MSARVRDRNDAVTTVVCDVADLLKAQGDENAEGFIFFKKALADTGKRNICFSAL